MSRDPVRHVLPALVASLLLAAVAAGAQEDAPAAADLGWEAAVSDVPLIDLSGTWYFAPAQSDPMVEEWRDREVVYSIQQFPDRILFDFRPEDGRGNVQGYRWNGEVSAFERGDAEVRERARWTDGGRTLVVEGRWWLAEDPADISAYTFRYSLDRPDRLRFEQSNESGETVWRFERR